MWTSTGFAKGVKVEIEGVSFHKNSKRADSLRNLSAQKGGSKMTTVIRGETAHVEEAVARVQATAPDFTAQAVTADGKTKELRLSDYRGKYMVLFFYPLDFTFVCPTEIIALSDRIGEFKERGAEVVGISVDSPYSHIAWRNTPRKKGGIGEISFPLISDLNKAISAKYGVLLEKPGIALRGLFILDRDGKVRHMSINDLPLGRNVEEILRVIDEMQFNEKHGEVCPANWKKGEKGMKPTRDGLEEYASRRY
jgi:peroxiredoxin (alkyl hydroperoxide reductase subunit C)